MKDGKRKDRFDGTAPTQQEFPHECFLEVDVVCVSLDTFAEACDKTQARCFSLRSPTVCSAPTSACSCNLTPQDGLALKWCD